MRKIFLVLMLLTVSAWAQAPDAVVDRFYRTYWTVQDENKAIRSESRSFTPGFYALLDRVMRLQKRQTRGDSDAFFVVGNGGWGDWEVGQASIDGNNALVPLTLWCGLRSGEVRKNAKLRREWDKSYGNVYLTNLGEGWQIYNLKFFRHKDRFSQNETPELDARSSVQAQIQRLSKP